MQNSEVISATVTAIEFKQGVSKKEKAYHLALIAAKIAEDSGFKSSLPVVFNHFINKGESPPEYKVGDKIRISIDALEIDKRSIKVTKGVIL